MDIWKRNKRILEQHNKSIEEKISEIIDKEETDYVFLEKAENTNLIPGVIRDGRKWYLNSRLDPARASMIYADRYPVRVYNIYLVFGFGDGRVIREMLDRCDKTNKFLICEPDENIFAKVATGFDLTEILEDERIELCIPKVEDNLISIIHHIIAYSNIKLVEFCVLPGYDVLYPTECEKFIDETIEKIRNEVVQKNTYVGFNRMIPQHTLFNMKNMIGQRNFGQVKKIMEGFDLSKIPAIIVSAGPSLDKNIKELKKAEGKAFILVVDAALRTVLRAGIRPDVVCTIDPESPDRFFENMDLKDIIWSCNRITRPWILENFGQKVFYYNPFISSWDEKIIEELPCEHPIIWTGGCVSSDAFLLAKYLGFETIILVGQDMAFTDGVSHTSGIEGAFGDNDEYIESRYRVQVEDANGNLLETDFQMWYYKLWFEKTIHKCEELRVINATEGGAKIDGAIIQTLRDTIEQECRQELDIYSILREMKPVFEEAQQIRLEKELFGIKEHVGDYCTQLKKSLAIQQKIKTYLATAAVDAKEVERMFRELTKQNKIVEEHSIMEWITLYSKAKEYELQENIFAEEELELEDLIDQGMKLIKGYQQGVAMFLEDVDKMLNI